VLLNKPNPVLDEASALKPSKQAPAPNRKILYCRHRHDIVFHWFHDVQTVVARGPSGNKFLADKKM
jgi:hypothetical protein